MSGLSNCFPSCKQLTCNFLLFRPSPTALPTVDDAAVQRAVEEVAAAVAHQEAEPRMQHAMAHDFNHGEAVSFEKILLRSESLISWPSLLGLCCAKRNVP